MEVCSLLWRMGKCFEVENVLMSSANWDMKVGAAGFGMLAIYVMNRIGLSAEPCGTPKLILMGGEDMLSMQKYVYLLERKLLMNLMYMVGIFLECNEKRRPLCQTLSKAFSTSMNTEAHLWCLFFA